MDTTKLDQTAWTKLDGLLDEALELIERRPEDLSAFLLQVKEPLRSRLEAMLKSASSDDLEAWVGESVVEALQPNSESETVTGFRVGPWRLERRLGAGGMAQVFYAVRSEEGYEQAAAIKILLPFRKGEEFLIRFVRERRILAALEHPNIARFVDGGVLDDDRPWLAMEYVEGVSITSYCAGNALSVGQRLNLFLQVCEAMEYAHGRLIVHRDIKPENILVDDGGRVRLLDFGIAKMLDEIDASAQTRTGNSMMTLRYASPEQVTNAFVNTASDVYQLGLLLYEILVEAPPFDHKGKSLDEVIESICRVPAPAPSVRASELTRDVDEIVMQALRKEPENRYGSVAALAEDIRRYLGGLPIRARPPSRWYYFQRFVGRNRLGVALAAGTMLALSVAVVVSTRWAARANEEASRSATAQEILSGIFTQADPFGDAGANVTLAVALANRMPDIERQIGNDSVLGTQIYGQLGIIYQSLGLHRESLRSWRRAFELVQRGGSEDEFVITVAGVAGALRENGDFTEAIAFARQHLPPRPRSDQEVEGWIAARISEAVAHERLSQFENVEDLVSLIDEVRITTDFSAPRGLMRLAYLQSALARHSGDADLALRHSRDALGHARATGLPDFLAVGLNNLAIALGRAGRFDESEPLFLEAIEVLGEFDPNHPTRGYHMLNYAGLLYRTGRRDEAVDLAVRGRVLVQASDNQHWQYTASRDLAKYAFDAGRIDMAVEVMEPYMHLAAGVFGPSSAELAGAKLRLARLAHFGGLSSYAASLLENIVVAHPKIGIVEIAVELGKVRFEMGDLDTTERLVFDSGWPTSAQAIETELRLACARGDMARGRSLRSEMSAQNMSATGMVWARLNAWFDLIPSDTGLTVDPKVSLSAAVKVYSAIEGRMSVLDQWRIMLALGDLAEAQGSSLPASMAGTLSDLGSLRRQAREGLLERYDDDWLALTGVELSEPLDALTPRRVPTFCAVTM